MFRLLVFRQLLFPISLLVKREDARDVTRRFDYTVYVHPALAIDNYLSVSLPQIISSYFLLCMCSKTVLALI